MSFEKPEQPSVTNRLQNREHSAPISRDAFIEEVARFAKANDIAGMQRLYGAYCEFELRNSNGTQSEQAGAIEIAKANFLASAQAVDIGEEMRQDRMPARGYVGPAQKLAIEAIAKSTL